MSVFAALDTYYNGAGHSAAMNMAIDDALLGYATVPSIRFYRWQSPALSFGYFGRFADVASYAHGRNLVRRWTGGGIVFHGDDLTYSIVIPASDPALAESSVSIYETIHHALRNALIASGEPAELAKGGDAAQRRTRAGLLHQGSIQRVDLGNGLAERFAKELSGNCNVRSLPETIHYRAQEIAARKYGTE